MIGDSVCRLGVIVAAEIRHPVLIPRGLAVRRGVVLSRLFAHPKDGGSDILSPRVELRRTPCGLWLDRLAVGRDDDTG